MSSNRTTPRSLASARCHASRKRLSLDLMRSASARPDESLRPSYQEFICVQTISARTLDKSELLDIRMVDKPQRKQTCAYVSASERASFRKRFRRPRPLCESPLCGQAQVSQARLGRETAPSFPGAENHMTTFDQTVIVSRLINSFPCEVMR